MNAYSFILLLISFLLLNTTAIGQKHIRIVEQLRSKEDRTNSEITLLVKSTENIDLLVASTQARIKSVYGDIYSISIPIDMVDLFTEGLSDQQHWEIPAGKAHALMDTAIYVNNIDSVHSGYLPLNSPYTGEGVIVGIIDAGIDFNHDDFKDEHGDTRIRYIWDQNVTNSPTPPLPYNYGQEWSWMDINNGTCTHVEPGSLYSHGTMVSGVAAGNGLASGHYKGVAPESEMIVVAFDFWDVDFGGKIVDAIDYIFKKADALGKPCVINTSLGSYWGSHDGNDLATEMIEAMLEEKNGRAIVAAAGNGNNINNTSGSYIPFHLGYDVEEDSAFTWFAPRSYDNTVFISMWADVSEFNQVAFSFGADDINQLTSIAHTPYFNILDFQGNLSQGIYYTQFLTDDSSNNIGFIELYLSEYNAVYEMIAIITPTDPDHVWRFTTKGNGRVDIWSSEYFTNTSNMIFDNLPTPASFPDINRYQLPDNQQTIVSGWVCSDKIITVGNFANRHGWYDVDSTYWTSGLTPGEIYYSSSEGPTRDGRIKPDISSTGNIVFSSSSSSFIASALAVNRKKVAPDTLHTYNGGTSTSSPVVAGSVALYLEKNPNAGWEEIKQALLFSAKRDAFTGPDANNQYGYGKLNAFNMMQYEAIYGCMDSTAFNYDSTANIDDGSCIPVVTGCTDSTALNYNAQANTDDGSCIPVVLGCTDSDALNYDEHANVDDGSCIPIVFGCMDSTAINFDSTANVDDGSCDYIHSGLHGLYASAMHFSLYPNPAGDIVNVYVSQPNESYQLLLYDILGNVITHIHAEKGHTKVNIQHLESGVYLVRIKSLNGLYSATQKLTIE